MALPLCMAALLPPLCPQIIFTTEAPLPGLEARCTHIKVKARAALL